MISRVLSDWQNKNGLNYENDCVYGVYNEYGFSVCDENNGKLIVFTVIAKNDECYKKLQQFYVALGRFFKRVTVGRVENYLALFIDESRAVITCDELDELIEFTSNNLITLGFAKPQTCFKCGQPVAKFTLIDKKVRPVCHECGSIAGKPAVSNVLRPENPPYIKEEKQQINFESQKSGDADSDERDEWLMDRFAEENDMYDDFFEDSYPHESDGSVITGFIGSLIGSVIGAAAFIGVYMSTNWMLSVLCFLSPIISGGLYMLLRGIRSKSIATTMIFTFSFAASVISVVFTNICEQLKSFNFSFQQAIDAVETLNMQIVLTHIGLAFAGVVVGTFIMRKMLAGYTE